jgi:chemotaxis protein methyltransferase CheR
MRSTEAPGQAGTTATDEAGQPRPLAAGLTPAQFTAICQILYRVTGIRLQPGKEELVKARLWRRLYTLGLDSYQEYIDLIQGPAGAEELVATVDALSTNKTSFFREPQHFEFLREQVASRAQRSAPLHIWSAGCSSGEEPYSIAITLRQALPEAARRQVRILATDISTRVLRIARAGLYAGAELNELPRDLRASCFTADPSAGPDRYRVAEAVRAMVQFARLNLMTPWPMRGPFDFIFCRNVMIYFDRPTQDHLVQEFGRLLVPGGHLLVGHSETLSGRAPDLQYRMPAVYQKL